MARQPRIWEIVLTGGPCSGKTTSLAQLSEILQEQQLQVLVVPEVATLLVTGGLPSLAALAADHPRQFRAVEEQMLLLVRDLRARYLALAQALGRDTVILYDRGEMDCCAYLGRPMFERLLRRHGLGYAEVRDSYDRVIHLVSTAVDIPEHYTLANNPARSESVEQAADSDRRCLAAWTGAHLSIIDNSSDFAGKLERVVRAVLQTIGLPAPLEIERKFLLAADPGGADCLADAQLFDITQTYLRSAADVERRLRLRAHAGQETCIYTTKRPSGFDPRVREETEERISRDEYRRLLAEADPSCQPIRKQRRVFVEGQQVFELDSYLDRDLHILEVELHDVDTPVRLPAGLQILREVSGEAAYSNHALAARRPR